MNTASHSSISRNVGVRMGPRRRISIMRATNIASTIGHARIEPLRTDQAAQCEIGFKRRARRADPDRSAASDPLFKMTPDVRSGHRVAVQQRLTNPPFAIDELIAKPPAVAQEVSVHFVVIAIDDAAQSAVALAGIDIAPESTMHANRGSKLLIPLAGVMVLQGLIREHTRRTDFDQIAAELILQDTIFVRPKNTVLREANAFRSLPPA